MPARPQQNDFPVWYFLYDILADPEELPGILQLDSTPGYLPAIVYGGKSLSEEQLIDATPSYDSFDSVVPGQAIQG